MDKKKAAKIARPHTPRQKRGGRKIPPRRTKSKPQRANSGAQPQIFAKSIRHLARQLNKSDAAVRKWLAREDWPFPRKPPWDVRQVEAWAEINLKPNPAAAYQRKITDVRNGSGEYGEVGALTRAKIQVTLERAMWIRQRRLTEAKKLIDAGQVQRQWLEHIQAVKSQLMVLPRSIANELVGSKREEIEQILTQRIVELLNDFASSNA